MLAIQNFRKLDSFFFKSHELSPEDGAAKHAETDRRTTRAIILLGLMDATLY